LKVNGDFSVRSLECYGSISISGDAEVIEDIIVKGALDVNSLTVNGDFSVNGGARISSDLECMGKVEIHGGIRVDGDLECLELTIRGGLLVSGDTRINKNCEVKGGIKIEGDLEVGGNLIIELSGQGKSEIKGDIIINENLKVTREKGESNLIIYGEVKVNGEAYMEYTEVKNDLKARRIILGANTIIHGDVYYTDEIDLDSTVVIKGRTIKIIS